MLRNLGRLGMARRPPSLSPECPECGAQYCKQRQTGADEHGQRIRERVCRECDYRFITVESVVPGVKFSQVDVERKAYQKLWKRQKNGWWGQRTYKRPKPLLVRVLVTIF